MPFSTDGEEDFDNLYQWDFESLEPELLTPGPFRLSSVGDSALLIVRVVDKNGVASSVHSLQWISNNPDAVSVSPIPFGGSELLSFAAHVEAKSNGVSFVEIRLDRNRFLGNAGCLVVGCEPDPSQIRRLVVPVTVEQVPVALRLTPSPDVTLEQLSEPGAVAVELQDARGNKVVGSWHRYRLSVADTTILRLSGPRVEATWDPRPGGGRDNYWTASFYEGGTISITGLRDGSTYLKAQTVLYDSEGFSTGTLADSILVTVRQGVASVEIDPAGPLTFTSLGEQRALTARVRDAGGAPVASAQPTWQSSDPAVVTVDDRGLIRAAALGSAEIVAEAGGATSPPLRVTVEQRAARIRVTPAEAERLESLGATLDLSAIVEDAGGNPIPGASVTWQTSNAAVVTIDEAGRVTAIGNGAAIVRASTATYASASGSATAVVSPPVEIVVRQRAANVAITPEGAITLDAVGASATFGVVARDAGGAGITSPEVTWLSSDPEVAAVDGSGRVTAVANGAAAITAQVDGVTSAPVQVTVDLPLPDLVEVSIAAGLEHTCGLAADGTASCWGGNDLGQVGDNTRDSHRLPVSVATELKFVQIRSGRVSTCGLTATGQIYCWGDNNQGQLGIGTSDEGSAIPVLVTSGQVFTALAVMAEHVCAIDSDQSAWCWGSNFDGQVGTGFGDPFYTTPRRVAGEHRFIAIADGLAPHTCGISTTGHVLCWGSGGSGQLGNGLGSPNLVPEPVTVFGGGGLPSFASVAVGANHTCALSTEGEAFCWGGNSDRALGDGSTGAFQFTPTRVATDLRFASITAGDQFTCARTAGGDLYCWGRNADGQLGDGTTTLRSEPTRVAGSHAFREISAGEHFVCGVTTSGDAYCWGRNWAGQLGDGTITSPRTTPTLVGGGLRFGPP